jgi:hypothetical protein
MIWHVPTARQKADASKQLRRESERARRQRDREALVKLRANIRHARSLRKAQRREVIVMCQRGRAAARARVQALRAEYRAQLIAAVDSERSAARTACTTRQTRVRESGRGRMARAVAAMEHERKHQQHMRRFAKPASLKGRKASARRAIEAITESDSEVRGNIPHELLPVWRAVKGKIKGTPRRSRTETFFEWVAEHEPQVRSILHRQFERDVDEMMEHEEELRSRVMSPTAYRAMSDRQLSEVPF